MLSKTRLDNYITARYRRPVGDSPIRYVLYTYLGKSLPYFIPGYLLFLKDLSIYIIYPIVLLVGLPIYIFILYLNPY